MQKITKYFFEKNITEKIINIILIIYPIFIMVNNDFTLNIINNLILILALIQIKIKGFKYSFLEKWIVVFLFSILISFIGAKIIRVDAFRDLLKWIFIPLLLGQFTIKEETKKYMFYTVPVGIGIYLWNIYQMIEGKIPSRFGERYSYGKMLPQYALILGFVIGIYSIILIFEKENWKNKILESMIIVITTVLLVITQSRGMYIALPTALLFSIFIKKRKYFFILIIIFGLSFPIVNNKFSDNVYLARFKSISSTSDVSINSRYEVMNESIRLFKKNPINGIGYENFMELQDNSNYKYNYKYHHAHNMAIKMLGETGIIGFVGYFFMLGTIFIHSLKRAREKIEYLILLTATTILAIYENFELIIHGNHAYPILFFIIAVVINEEYESRKNKLEVKQ